MDPFSSFALSLSISTQRNTTHERDTTTDPLFPLSTPSSVGAVAGAAGPVQPTLGHRPVLPEGLWAARAGLSGRRRLLRRCARRLFSAALPQPRRRPPRNRAETAPQLPWRWPRRPRRPRTTDGAPQLGLPRQDADGAAREVLRPVLPRDGLRRRPEPAALVPQRAAVHGRRETRTHRRLRLPAQRGVPARHGETQ